MRIKPHLRSSQIIFSMLLLLALLASNLSPAIASSQASEETIAFSLADLGMSDILADQIFEQVEVHFRVAEGFKVNQAVLNLHFEHSNLLLAENSDIRIALNDEPVTNFILDASNAPGGYQLITLPVSALRSGENSLLMQINQRLLNTGCADFRDPNLWVKVYADTSLQLTKVDIPIVPDLSRFPAPFDTLVRLPGFPQIAFILPDNPISAELTAEARIAAALGQAAGWDDPPFLGMTVSQTEALNAQANHLVVINLGGRNPLAAGTPYGLTEQVSPLNPNRLMLTVSAGDVQGLLQAANQMATRSARVALPASAGSSTSPISGLLQDEPPDHQSFTGLGFTDQHLSGIGFHDLYYPIDLPADWKVTNDASIDLHFTHSREIQSSRSRTKVYINGFQVTNIGLNNRNAADGRLIIQLSPRQLHPGRNWLHINIELHMPNEDCNYRYLEETWYEISASNSSVSLAHITSQPPLDLRYLPSPFVTPIDLSNDVFVLPDKPSWADLTALVRLAGVLGTSTQADGLRPVAMTASEFFLQQIDTTVHSNHIHVIAFGSPRSNALVEKYDNQLPQPLKLENGAVVPSGGRDLLPGERALNNETEPAAGYLQLLIAPWSRQDVLLVVTSYGDIDLLTLADVLPGQGERLHLEGNTAVVTSATHTGLTLGTLAASPVSGMVRIILASLLISSFLIIAGAVWFNSFLRRRSVAPENANDDDNETL